MFCFRKKKIKFKKSECKKNTEVLKYLLNEFDQWIVILMFFSSLSFFHYAYLDFLEFDRKFEALENLASHVTTAHAIASATGLYYCRWEKCARSDRGFNARYKMLVHVRTHTKEKPHHCTECTVICGKKFKIKTFFAQKPRFFLYLEKFFTC